MSEAKFTKGPWQRSGVRRKLGAEDCLQVGPDGFPVAFVPIGRLPQEHAGAIADANLMSAAPELFAQLSEAFHSVGKSELRDIYGTEWWEATRAVLAKALGEPSHG